MDCAALVLGIITLIITLAIHSEVRQALSRINVMIDILPGAYDVNRLIKDIENTGDQRGHVISYAPKNTYIAFCAPWPETSRYKKIKNRIWKWIFKLTQLWSGDIYESLVQTSKSGKWAFNYAIMGSSSMSQLIAEGWEPFSVTRDHKIWLRKLVETKE